MANFNLVSSITWTPPKAITNSGVSTLGTTGVYNAASVGTIDVPPGTVVGTVFSVPFGHIDSLKVIVIRNDMSSDIGVRINGSVTDNFEIAAGGELHYMAPTAPATTPITSLSVVTTLDPAQTESIYFWAFGD